MDEKLQNEKYWTLSINLDKFLKIRNKYSFTEMNEANERSPVKFEGNTFLKFVNSVTKM